MQYLDCGVKKLSFYNQEFVKKKELIKDSGNCEYANCYNFANVKIVNAQEEILKYCHWHYKLTKGYYKGVKIEVLKI